MLTLAASRAMLTRFGQSSCCANSGEVLALAKTSNREPRAQNCSRIQLHLSTDNKESSLEKHTPTETCEVPQKTQNHMHYCTCCDCTPRFIQLAQRPS